MDSTIPLLSKSKISSLWPSSVPVQPGLCRMYSETTLLVFACGGSFIIVLSVSMICVLVSVSFTEREKYSIINFIMSALRLAFVSLAPARLMNGV